MQRINLHEIKEGSCISPKEKFKVFEQEISLALGRDPKSTDLRKRHPFDLSLVRVLK